jgi:hypothetical protein
VFSITRRVRQRSAAADKWAHGRLLAGATLEGHSAAVACIAVSDTKILTGSSDGTARVWDLAHGMQLHVLRMPQGQPVLAVALPSITTAVTACGGGSGGAAGMAVLWRAGRAVRRFDALVSEFRRALAQVGLPPQCADEPAMAAAVSQQQPPCSARPLPCAPPGRRAVSAGAHRHAAAAGQQRGRPAAL